MCIWANPHRGQSPFPGPMPKPHARCGVGTKRASPRAWLLRTLGVKRFAFAQTDDQNASRLNVRRVERHERVSAFTADISRLKTPADPALRCGIRLLRRA